MISLRFETLAPGDLDWAWAVYDVTTREQVEQSVDWTETRQREERLKGLATGSFEAIVDETGQRVGVLQVTDDGPELTIRHLEVLPTAQGRGVGTAVIESVIGRAAASGRAVSLRVLKVNPRARALYERLGFALVEERSRSIEMRLAP